MLREEHLLLLMYDALDDKSDRSSSIHKPCPLLMLAKHKHRFQVRLVVSVLSRKAALKARARERNQIRKKHGPKHCMAAAWWVGNYALGDNPACVRLVSS